MKTWEIVRKTWEKDEKLTMRKRWEKDDSKLRQKDEKKMRNTVTHILDKKGIALWPAVANAHLGWFSFSARSHL